LGDSGDVAFPKLLLQASLDTAAREMDAIKGRKSEISLARVHQRIQRRVERMKEAMR
jgi:arginine/lysine/ornithine decarboxylase